MAQGQTLIGERSDCVMDRNTVYQALFNGKKVKEKHMFSTIQTYSPTGYPRPVPHIAANVDKYNKYVRKNLEKARLFKLNKT